MQKRRYPLMPIFSIFLKIMAVAALAFFGFNMVGTFVQTFKSWFNETPMQGMYGMSQMMPAVTDFKQRMLSLMTPTIYFFIAFGVPALLWGLSDMMNAVRDIEFRTRIAGAKQEAAPVTSPVEKEEATV